MTKELNIITGGLPQKRSPHITAELAKAARERPRVEAPQVKAEELEPEKITYKLSMKMRGEDSAIFEFDTQDELMLVFNKLKYAMVEKDILEIELDGCVCVLHGAGIERLRRPIVEEVV